MNNYLELINQEIPYDITNFTFNNWILSRDNEEQRRCLIQGLCNHLSSQLHIQKYPVIFEDLSNNDGVFKSIHEGNNEYYCISIDKDSYVHDIILNKNNIVEYHDIGNINIYNTCIHEQTHASQYEKYLFTKSATLILKDKLGLLDKSMLAIKANIHLYISANLSEQLQDSHNKEMAYILYRLQPMEREAFDTADKMTSLFVQNILSIDNNDIGATMYPFKKNQTPEGMLIRKINKYFNIYNFLDQYDNALIQLEKHPEKEWNDPVMNKVKTFIDLSKQQRLSFGKSNEQTSIINADLNDKYKSICKHLKIEEGIVQSKYRRRFGCDTYIAQQAMEKLKESYYDKYPGLQEYIERRDALHENKDATQGIDLVSHNSIISTELEHIEDMER